MPKTPNTAEGGRKKRRERDRRYRRKNPDKVRSAKLKYRYGITLHQYNELLVAQDGTCAICDRPETAIDPRTKKPRNLAVDHDHSTGRVRGLLCSSCNTAIGHLMEHPETLLAAARYSAKHSEGG